MDAETSGKDLLANLPRLKNILQDGNKVDKKKALIALEKYFSVLNEETLSELEFDNIVKPLLHCFIDETEKCRELAITIVSSAIHLMSDITKMLPYIIPVLVQRLASDKIVEESEEIRLALVVLLNYIIQNKNLGILPYMEDCINILKHSVTDQSPDIMKTCCSAIVTLARITVPNFHMQSESLVKPILQILHHRHSKVRIAAIEALGATIKYGNNKSVDDVRAGLIQRVFDQNPSVLKVLYGTMGDWLLNLPDRYSYFSKILPIFLSGLTSDMEDVRKECLHQWEEIGYQYLAENEPDIKDQLDFCPDTKDNPYEGIRFNLGCRKLIYRHLGSILQPLLWDLEDWLVQNKVKAAELLHTLLWNAEQDMTQYLDRILAALLKHANDKDKPFHKWIIKCCEVVGFHISSAAWIPLIITPMTRDPSVNYLIVLNALIRKSPLDSLTLAVDDIVKILCNHDVCLRYEIMYFENMLAIADILLTSVPNSLVTHHYQLFKLLRIIKSLGESETIALGAKKLMCELSNLPSNNDEAVPRNLMLAYLQELHHSCNDWTSGSLQRQIFEASALDADLSDAGIVDEILQLLDDLTKAKTEPSMKMKVVGFLGRLLQAATDNPAASELFRGRATKIIEDFIFPYLKWYAGKTENVVRSAAAACLHIVVSAGWLERDRVEQDKWAPLLVSLCDDENSATRSLVLEILQELFCLLKTDLSYDMFLKVYPAILQRLDDCSDDIRLEACKALCQLSECFTADIQHVGMETQFEYLYKTTLVHLDDQKDVIQQAVYECLAKLGPVCPKVLKEKVNEVADKHRNRSLCDSLLDSLEGKGDQ